MENKNVTLDSELVNKIFLDCLLREDGNEIVDGKPACDHVVAEGIINSFAFNTKRLNDHAEEIGLLVDQLPIRLEPVSFLQLCMDKEGRQWANEHKIMEQIVALGVATKKLAYGMPRELWGICPGGVPYIGLEENRELWDVFSGNYGKPAEPAKPQSQPGDDE